MSQYLSLRAFAAKIGCPEGVIEALVAQERIKAYQVADGESFIHVANLLTVKELVSQSRPRTDNEANVIQAEKDQVSRAASRAKIAAERKEEDIKLEKRRLKLSKRFAP